MKDRAHSQPSFSAWLNKGFELRAHAAQLSDGRSDPENFPVDTLRYSLCGFELNPLEAMLVDVNRRLKRGMAFDEGRVQGRLVAALDGTAAERMRTTAGWI